MKRERPPEGEDEKTSFYGTGYIFLSLERTGKNTEAFDQDDDVEPACKVAAEEHSRFDAVTLHEIGHAVDDHEKFMTAKGSSPEFGGWRKQTVEEVAEAVGEAKGFFKDFPQPRALLRTYLAYVLKGEDDPRGKMKGTISTPDFGAAVVTKEELLGAPSLAQAGTDRERFLRDGWDQDLVNKAASDVAKLSKLKAKKFYVLKEVLVNMLPSSAEASLSAADAVAAALAKLFISVDVNVDASNPDWAAMSRHSAVEVCKGIRYDGKNGLWSQKASGASKFGLGGRVYQEAYKGDWYSYDAAARKKGVSSYQFRAPGEWFAEVYSAFFMEKLPKAHPLHKWLTEQVQAPN